MSDPKSNDHQTVTVAAVHGSLECTGRYVLVGHFQGTPIAGGEAFLDERLGRRLTRRQLLGQYPEGLGEALVLDAHPSGGRAAFPPGGIVVGLDLPGELTRDRLTAAVSAGLLEFAVHTMERGRDGGDDRPPEILQIAAIPIGTSGVGAISLESCVAALVDGAAQANEALFHLRDQVTDEWAWDRVRIGGIEIVEVLADRAEQAAHAVRRCRDLAQVDATGHSDLELIDRVVVRDGGLPAALASRERSGDWQRVIVRNPARENVGAADTTGAASVSTLEFTAIGRRARADAMRVQMDVRAVERLVGSAVRDVRPDPQVGKTLYELLLPNELKNDLARSENVQLIVDENTADVPWEALTARFGNGRARELALRGGFLRQFRDAQRTSTAGRSPYGGRALVIGNPPPPPGSAPLPGAKAEAMAVAEALKDKFEVFALVWNDNGDLVMNGFPTLQGDPGQRVLGALFSQDWRILHIAAHGRFEPDDPAASGVVIDAETAITANVVRQLAAVPELVFLNCCHLGRVAGEGSLGPPSRNRMAASIARELMGIGVSTVVAAGWAVDDVAAVRFAVSLYERLLEGDFLGEAVRTSRRRVHQEVPESTTWAAFQCYGDPGYRFFSAGARGPSLPNLVSADELVRRAKTIKVLAGKIGLPDFDDLSEREAALAGELDAHLGRVDENGWGTALVLFHLGRAYGELGHHRQALECLRRSWAHPEGNTVPAVVIEQMGDLEIRLAQARHRAPAAAGQDDSEGADQLAAAALDHLTQAVGLGPTPGRLALLGRFHTRAATMAKGAARKAHLVEAARNYAEAASLAEAQQAEGTICCRVRCLQLRVLAGEPVSDADRDMALAAAHVGPPEEAEDFWRRIKLGELHLTSFLLGDKSRLALAESELRQAFGARASRNDHDVVIDYLRDLADLRGGAELVALVDEVATWRSGVGAAPGGKVIDLTTAPRPAGTPALPAREVANG